MKTSARDRLSAAAITGVLLGLGALVSFQVRFRAWPEVLVPSYLCGRGWLLYRDIKVVHSPLSIGLLAAVSRFAGFAPASLRICAFAPVAAVLVELARYARERGWSPAARIFAGLFFVAVFFAWDGNAVYPEVLLAALAIPAYAALRRGGHSDIRRAGWILGAALMVKQPSLFAVLFAFAWVATVHRSEVAPFLARVAAIPAICAFFFAAAGSARDFFKWTLLVPFLYYRGRTTLPIQPSETAIVLAGVVPLLCVLLLGAVREKFQRESLLLAGLTGSFTLLAFPHFELVHLLASAPLLAAGAGEVLTPGPPPQTGQKGGRMAGVKIAAQAAVVLAVFLLGAYLATDSSAGEMSFWSSTSDEAVLGRLSRLAPAPLFLYGVDQNLFVRSGRVPPGGIYSNPDLWFHYLVDGLEDRQARILADHPETVVLEGLQAPIATPRRVLPLFLAAHYRAEQFTRDGVRRLVPAPDGGTGVRRAAPPKSAPWPSPRREKS